MKYITKTLYIVCFVLAYFCVNTSYAQDLITLKGLVSDESGEPIIGANVLVKGSTNGTITDFDGRFTLNVPKNSTLEISFIGYETKSIQP